MPDLWASILSTQPACLVTSQAGPIPGHTSGAVRGPGGGKVSSGQGALTAQQALGRHRKSPAIQKGRMWITVSRQRSGEQLGLTHSRTFRKSGLPSS